MMGSFRAAKVELCTQQFYGRVRSRPSRTSLPSKPGRSAAAISWPRRLPHLRRDASGAGPQRAKPRHGARADAKTCRRPQTRGEAMTTFHWKNAANGSFNTASAWIPQGVPGAADTAVIDDVGTYTVSSTSNNEVTELDTI